MICQNCGTTNNEDAQFCVNCGQTLYTGNGYAAGINEQNYSQENYTYSSQDIQSQAAQSQSTYIPQGQNGFVNADEKVIATLKNGRVMNILSNEGFMNERAVLTNRRLYYNCTDGLISTIHMEKKVDIRDITATKIEDSHPRMLLILALAMFVIGALISVESVEAGSSFITMAVFPIIFYFIRVKKCMRIDYAGGYVYFSVKNYSMENVREFQRCIHALKDTMQ